MFHADTLLTLYNLFIIYYNEGEFDVVRDLILKDVLQIDSKSASGEQQQQQKYMDWNILDTMLKLAFTYHQKGSTDDATTLYEAYIRSFTDYTTNSSNGTTMISTGEERNALIEYQDLLSVQHNLGVLYQEGGEYVKAKDIIEQCLGSRLAALGKSHQLTLGTMNNLAALCHKMGDYSDAKSLYCDCYNEKVHCLGEDHPETQLTFRNIERLKEVFPF